MTTRASSSTSPGCAPSTSGATVLISGPSSDGMTGIYVLRVASREGASGLAASDPLARDDRVRIEIIEWDVHQLLGIGSFDPPPAAT
jgi:hypothetical protein